MMEFWSYYSPLRRWLCVLARGARGVLKRGVMTATHNSNTLLYEVVDLNPLSLALKPAHGGDFIRFILTLVFLFYHISSAQSVSVTATVDSQTVTIGDWIRYSVDIKHPAGIVVAIPSFKDTLGKFDIVQQDSLIRTEENNAVELKKNFVITRFDAGSHIIPPFVVQYRDAAGNILFAQSNLIPVEVRGVEVDTSKSIRDIKPPRSIPLSAEEIALYAALALLVVAAGYGIFYYIKKKKRVVAATEEAVPDIPAHVLALLQLDELEQKQLWQKGEFKLYYSEATEIIRRYFEKRYGILALEMTTGEVMEQLQKLKIEHSMLLSIEQLLSWADLVKFAKYRPSATECSDVLPAARKIVEKTKQGEPVVQHGEIKKEAAVNA